MDDTLRNIGIGLGLFAVLHFGLESGARAAAAHSVRRALGSQGYVSVSLRPAEPFGVESGGFRSLRVRGRGLDVGGVPFSVFPGGGWNGRIDRLHVYLTDSQFAGLPVRWLSVDVPDVCFSEPAAIFGGRLRLTRAGVGTLTANISAHGLEQFIAGKYGRLLSHVQVSFQVPEVSVWGTAALSSGPSPVLARGTLSVRDGRYVDLTNAVVVLDGRVAPPGLTALLVGQVNPVLDVVNDLHLDSTIVLTGTHIRPDSLELDAAIHVPAAGRGAPPPGP